MSKKITFKCKEERLVDGGVKVVAEEKEFAVSRPNAQQQREGQKAYNRAFSDAVQSGCILRAKLEDFMRTQGMWDDNKQREFTEINKSVNGAERRIRAGGFDFDEAVSLAKEVRGLRAKLRDLVSVRTDLDVNTAEGQADNARFNYFVSACLVYNDTQKPVFKDLDDYLANSATDQAIMGANKLAQALYGISDDYELKYPENQFLLEFGLINEKNRFVDEQGRLVDSSGRLVNEFGHYILEDGTLCDVDGNPIDKDGDYIVEKKPFTKNGVPVEPKKKEEKAEEPSSEILQPAVQ